jgi:hypothetical protein
LYRGFEGENGFGELGVARFIFAPSTTSLIMSDQIQTFSDEDCSGERLGERCDRIERVFGCLSAVRNINEAKATGQ